MKKRLSKKKNHRSKSYRRKVSYAERKFKFCEKLEQRCIIEPSESENILSVFYLMQPQLVTYGYSAPECS